MAMIKRKTNLRTKKKPVKTGERIGNWEINDDSNAILPR